MEVRHWSKWAIFKWDLEARQNLLISSTLFGYLVRDKSMGYVWHVICISLLAWMVGR